MIEYTIISINEKRAENKANIRKAMPYAEADIEFVNGYDSNQIDRMFDKYPIHIKNWMPKVGELGVWFSQIQCWDYLVNADLDALIVFEDDALVSPAFSGFLDLYMPELPEDWDFLSLCVPENQRQDFWYRQIYDNEGAPKALIRASDEPYKFDYGVPTLARAYQGYCCVATMYSKQGAQKLLRLAEEYGIYTPVDCFLFLQAHAGRLNAYAPKPDAPMGVAIDWHIETTIHNTELFKENDAVQ